MRFGSLFAGIGGMDLGLERAGMECAWQVEIDPFCRKVLTKHWPDVPKYEDVRDVGAHNLESVDLICGGFPCQDVSQAGNREGIEGRRSGLWSEYCRIVRELRPNLVLVENVSGLLVRGADRVLGDLAEIGYDAEWDCIPAAAVGAPHRRDRIFVLAYPGGVQRGERVGAAVFGRREDEAQQAWVGGSGANVANAAGKLGNGGNHNGGSGPHALPESGDGRETTRSDRSWWALEPDVGRVAHGVPARVDRLRGLGNAVVPQVAEWIGRRIMEASSRA